MSLESSTGWAAGYYLKTLQEAQQTAQEQEELLSSARTKLKDLEDRLVQERTLPTSLQTRVTNEKGELEKLNTQLQAEADPEEAASVTDARRLAQQARLRLRQEELAELKARMGNETGANGPEPVQPAPQSDTDKSANG